MMSHRHLVIGILAFGCIVALVGCSDDSTGTNNNGNNNNSPVCGNGQQEGTEECDGADLTGETCQSQGLPGGTLSCYGNCTFDTTSCDPPVTCGNGAVDEPQEECDGSLLNGQTCVTLGYASGNLTCAQNCQFDESQCETGPECGDGNVDAGEQCDGANLGGATCVSRGYDSGTLSCSSTTCQFDESQCVPEVDCGNGQIDTGEQCDGSNLNNQTCETQGLDGGTLSCTGGCLFDTTGCHACGDGVRNGTEECDGSDFGTSTCTNAGHASGSLACLGGCTIDTSGCYTCGDGNLDGPEVCDGVNVGTETCQSVTSLSEGTLACDSSCLAFETTDCHECGNGLIDGPELCDGTSLSGETCVGLGFDAGWLGCAANCAGYDTSGCMSLPVCVVYVTDTPPNPSADGLSWATAFSDIQQALDLASALLPTFSECDVWVAAGTYDIYQGSRFDTIQLRSGVGLYGGFDGTEQYLNQRDWQTNVTILNGQGAESVYHVVKAYQTQDTPLDGFTVTGGNADRPFHVEDSSGGGLFVDGASIEVRHCIFEGNAAEDGGGVAVRHQPCLIDVSDCLFLNNSAQAGGGLFVLEGAVTVTRTTFDTNTSAGGVGGGMYAGLATPVSVSDCDFLSNTTNGSGGGLGVSAAGQVTISGCNFVYNSKTNGYSGGGAALYLSSTTGTLIRDCTFLGNQSDEDGGAVYADSTDLMIHHCVIQDNQASAFGGGVYLTDTPGTALLDNLIIVGNSVVNYGGGIHVDVDAALLATNLTIVANSATWGGGMYVDSDASNPSTLINSIIWGNSAASGAGVYEGGALTYEHNDIQGCTCANANGNIDINPLFVNSGAGDYHLQWFSACVDAGWGSITISATDLEGVTRYDNGMAALHGGAGTPNYVDMGAFEYHP